MLNPNTYISLRQSLPSVGEIRCLAYFTYRLDISYDFAIQIVAALKDCATEYLESHEEHDPFTDISRAMGHAYRLLDIEMRRYAN